VAAELFLDTSAWFPLLVSSRAEHHVVATAVRDALRGGARLVTTNLVIAETHALMLTRVSGEAALRFVRDVAESPTIVIRSSAELERAALSNWLERYDDQDFSFADAISFAVMAERGITEALTLDHHFAAAGFRMAPTPSRGSRSRH
jgi:uncharacterized protein